MSNSPFNNTVITIILVVVLTSITLAFVVLTPLLLFLIVRKWVLHGIAELASPKELCNAFIDMYMKIIQSFYKY